MKTNIKKRVIIVLVVLAVLFFGVAYIITINKIGQKENTIVGYWKLIRGKQVGIADAIKFTKDGDIKFYRKELSENGFETMKIINQKYRYDKGILYTSKTSFEINPLKGSSPIIKQKIAFSSKFLLFKDDLNVLKYRKISKKDFMKEW